MEFQGVVVRGQGLATIGYGVPTANLEFDEPVAVEPGVYVSYCWVEQVRFPSVTYVGPRGGEKFEVHLFGFDGNLYGSTLRVQLIEKISEHVNWESEEQMKKKIDADLKRAQAWFITPSSSAL